MLTGVANRFRATGLTTRVAIADTWGAAHACARVITRETVIVPCGEVLKAVEMLPLSLLRLPAKIVDDLRVLGFQTVGELANTRRAPLALRFGPELGRRIDQMFGRTSEPIEPIRSTRVDRGDQAVCGADRRGGDDQQVRGTPGRRTRRRAAAQGPWGASHGPYRRKGRRSAPSHSRGHRRAGTGRRLADEALQGSHREDRTGVRYRDA